MSIVIQLQNYWLRRLHLPSYSPLLSLSSPRFFWASPSNLSIVVCMTLASSVPIPDPLNPIAISTIFLPASIILRASAFEEGGPTATSGSSSISSGLSSLGLFNACSAFPVALSRVPTGGIPLPPFSTVHGALLGGQGYSRSDFLVFIKSLSLRSFSLYLLASRKREACGRLFQ